MVDLADLVPTEEACVIAKRSMRTWKRLVSEGVAPQPFRFGRTTRYSEREVTEWAKAHPPAERRRKAAAVPELAD